MSINRDYLFFGPRIPKLNYFERIMGLTIKCYRLVGIPLDPYGIRPPILRYWFTGFGVAMFLFNVIYNIYFLIYKIQYFEPTTKLWNLLINEINFVVFQVVYHAGLLFCTAPNWKELVNVLRQIEKLRFFQIKDYEIFKKTFSKANIINLIMVSIILQIVRNNLGF